VSRALEAPRFFIRQQSIDEAPLLSLLHSRHNLGSGSQYEVRSGKRPIIPEELRSRRVRDLRRLALGDDQRLKRSGSVDDQISAPSVADRDFNGHEGAGITEG
jgi:hypothetical protein